MKERSRTTRFLAEGLVIVVSILIAFALDASWDARNERIEAGELRSGLVEDFSETGVELQRVRRRKEEVMVAADSVLAALSQASTPFLVSSAHLGALLLTPTTDPQMGTLQALISSARLRIVGDEELQGLLSEWPARLSDTREEELAAKTFVHEQLTPALSEVVDLSGAFAWRLDGGTNETEVEVRLTPTDLVEFRNLIRTRQYLAGFVLTNYLDLERALEQIDAALTS